MQRLTKFFIGAGITIVVVTATLLGVKYYLRHNTAADQEQNTQIAQQQGQNTIPNNTTGEVTLVESDKSAETIATPEEINAGVTDAPKIVDTPANNPLATINPAKVNKAGFLNAELKISEFTGMTFNIIDFSEVMDNENLEYKILENNINSGIISELMFSDALTAGNMYQNLKNKIEETSVFTTNETNQYGENSFFANHAEEKNSVFLVVKKGTRLYTFHYPARNHNKMKNLIGLL